MNDLKRAKTAQATDARLAAREAHADGGPYLVGNQIRVPSPAMHPEWNAILRRYGFRFEAGYLPAWSRNTSTPHQGKVYSPEKWLQWARQHYAKAWPKWEGE